jgi:hypothetical protein
MAHFAELDQSNVVLRVVVVNNSEVGDLPFPESEPVGISFCQSLFGAETIWRQTSYNASFRKHYAGIGYTFDAPRDAFIPPQPYPSWAIDEDTCEWAAPVPYPNDGAQYVWDEAAMTWQPVPAVEE